MKKGLQRKWAIILCCCVSCLPLFLHAQQNNIDSIRQVIKKLPPGDNVRKAKSLIDLGQQYFFGSNYPAAMECYEQALATTQNSKNDSLEAGCYIGMAAIAYYQQDYNKDSVYHFKALEIFRRSHDTLHEAKTLRNIAASYAQRGNLVAATQYFEQATGTFKKLNQLKLVAGIYSNMAAMYRWDLRRSIELEMAAKQIWDKDPNDGVLPAANTGNLGIHYFYLVKFDSLRSVKHDSLITASPAENLQKAETYLRQAIAMAGENNDLNNQSHYMGELAELQEFKGNYKDAYFNISRFYQVQDSIFSQQNKNKIAALGNQRAIDLKNKEIENKELQIGNQRKRMWLLISFIGFLAILGIVLYRQGVIRKKTNTTLLQLNNELDEANKVKAKFFGILSHDLRSPVANLINFLELQKRKPGIMSEAQVADREKKITDAATSLLDTMEAMLLWSKGQMEHFKPTVTAVPVRDLFTYLQQFFANATGVTFSFSASDDLVAHTDENYLKTIMLNLTANAVKALGHTPGAQIAWKAWQENGNLLFSITDNGPGASNEQLKALYDETAGSSARNGLGLHIIRDLAKAIKCSITVTPAMKQGAEFVLSL